MCSHWSCLNVYFTFQETRGKWNCQRLDYWCHYLSRWEVEFLGFVCLSWRMTGKTCCAKILYLLSQDLNGSPKRETISQNYFFPQGLEKRAGIVVVVTDSMTKIAKEFRKRQDKEGIVRLKREWEATAKETIFVYSWQRKWGKQNFSWQRGSFIFTTHSVLFINRKKLESTSVFVYLLTLFFF